MCIRKNWLVLRKLIGDVLIGLILAVSGCIGYDEAMPEIVADYSHSEHRIVHPSKTETAGRTINLQGGVPNNWVPPAHLERNWTAIVIHHSATENGNAAIFGKWHREVRHWEGIGYDFVIGNGNDSGDGEVEVTFRWLNQMTGAHCGRTPGNWANKEAVGICLVGDFNRNIPTRRQMQSLVRLVRFLQKRYRIPKSRIYGHKTTPGASVTDCPGRNFPMARLKSMLDF
ncbi:MAG: N-acetylmuramoyl-L-alanine amidase [Sedimentisphaerales bacterium]|nr:N-acetylmuramoyl-L-alanine amidase [Sedimentisphaerales bacterium]